MSLIVTIDDGPVADHGTVVVFQGVDETGDLITFAVDHRMAQGLADAQAEHGQIDCDVEGWAILSRTPA